jgi:thiol-disulfide isomerase/thioredoxin
MGPVAHRPAPPTLILAGCALAVAALAGCPSSSDAPRPDPAAGKRSEAVKATAATATTTAPHLPTAPRAPRKLCEAPPAAAGHALPPGNIPSMSATGAVPLGDKIPAGGGRWTWVNLWAAWCGPCKEEIPRLKGWEAKLAQAGTPIHLAFVSLDDDQRQAQRFLEAQPATGLRASYWLQDGKPRSSWLEALKLKAEAQLPMHVLADGQGIVRCVIDGAVEDQDYPQIQAIVARRLGRSSLQFCALPGAQFPACTGGPVRRRFGSCALSFR